MKAKDCMLAWTPAWWSNPTLGPTRGEIEVGPIQSNKVWAAERYALTGGAAYLRWREANGTALKAMLFTEFHAMVVRDGIDPQHAHREFLKIDEYRKWIVPDLEGAD